MRHANSQPVQMLRKAHDERKLQTQEERAMIDAWLAERKPTPCPLAFVAETLQADPRKGQAAYVTTPAPIARDPRAARSRGASSTNDLARKRAKERTDILLAVFDRTGDVRQAAAAAGYCYDTARDRLRDNGRLQAKADRNAGIVAAVTQMLGEGKTTSVIAREIGLSVSRTRDWVALVRKTNNQAAQMAAE
jgi:hypothetical protein